MRAITQVFAATVAILLFIVPSSSFSVDGHAFDSCSVYVDLEDDIAHYEYEIVTFFDGGEDAYEFLFTADVKDVKVLLNDLPVACGVSYAVGNSVATCDMSGSLYGRNHVKVSYDSRYPLFSFDDMVMFRDSFVFSEYARSSRLSVKLPIGYILPEKSEYFITPVPTNIYSDGRRHILMWKYENVSDFEVSVMFERSSGAVWQSIPVIFLSFVIFVFLANNIRSYFGRKKKENTRDIVYSHLLESESAVVDALRSNMSVLKQKELQDITSFSKAKLSRVISNLESRGIVRKKLWGNSNKVFLVNEKDRKKKADETEKMHVSDGTGR